MKDLAKQTLDSLNEGAKHTAAAILSFLIACTLLGIAAASTTNEALLRDERLSLPLLAVGVPVTHFYTIAPLLILTLHLNLLLQAHVLARKLFSLSPEAREAMIRADLFSLSLPLQVLVTPPRPRLFKFLLRFISIFIYGFLPVVLLLWMELKFLPYHSEGVNTLYCLALAFDLSLLIYFLPIRFVELASRPMARWLPEEGASAAGQIQRFVGILFAIALVVCSAFAANVPDRCDPWVPWWPTTVFPIHLSGRELPRASQDSLNAVASTKDRPATLDLVERDLRCADFSGADLAGIDLRGAKLRRARFEGADLRRALLISEDISPALDEGTTSSPLQYDPIDLRLASLKGASLVGSRLNYARLGGADLTEAYLRGAHLHQASLRKARLRRADLSFSDLSSADLDRSDLEGADLTGARLQAAGLHAANLRDATLYCADLRNAHFDFAVLYHAAMSTADLEGWSAVGADLRYAELFGTAATLLWVDLRHARVWGMTAVPQKRSKPEPPRAGSRETEPRTIELADLRWVDFEPPEGGWKALLNQIRALAEKSKSTGAPEELSGACAARVKRGRGQPTTGFRHPTTVLPNLYTTELLATLGPKGGWPLPEITEDSYLHLLASNLVTAAGCKDPALTEGMVLRALGRLVPPRPELDDLLADEIVRIRESEPESCASLEQINSDLLRELLALHSG